MVVNLLCTLLLASFYTIGWPVGIVGLIMSSVLFYKIGLYADMVLQIILLSSFIYVWYCWGTDYKLDNVSKLNMLGLVITLLAVFIPGIIVAKLLILLTDSKTPFLDAFTASASLVCVFLASKKYISNWIIWFFVDLAYICMYTKEFHLQLLQPLFIY